MSEASQEESENEENLKCKQKKTLYFSAIGMACFFGVMDNLLSLESSINARNGLGSATELIFGVAGLCTSLFISPFIIKVLKPKTALIVGETAGSMYTVANFYPNWYTLSIGSVLLGFGETVSLVGSAALVGSTGKTEKNHTANMSIFVAIFSAGQIVVSLITEAAFQITTKKSHVSNHTAWNYSHCGSNDCPAEYSFKVHSQIFARLIPNQVAIYVLLSIYLAIQITGIAVHWFGIPSPIQSSDDETICLVESSKEGSSLLGVWKKTLLHVCSIQTLLILPVQLLNGLTLAFLWNEYTRGYISCTIGVEQVGLCVMFYFLFAMIANVVLEILNKYGVIVVMITCLITSIGTFTACLVWIPTHSNTFMLYILAGLLGLLFGTNTLSALVTSVVYFSDHANSLSLQMSMMGLGYTIMYSLAIALCVYVKLYFLIAFSVFAISCWVFAHIRYRKNGAL